MLLHTSQHPLPSFRKEVPFTLLVGRDKQSFQFLSKVPETSGSTDKARLLTRGYLLCLKNAEFVISLQFLLATG